MRKILIFDTDLHTREWLIGAISELGVHVEGCNHIDQVGKRVVRDGIDLVIAEVPAGERDIKTLVNSLRGTQDATRIILSSAYGSVEDAVDAMREGASDYLSKPFTWEQVQLSVERILEQAKLENENEALRAALDDRLRLNNFVATDPKMHAIFKVVNSVAPTRTTVLLTGESGTGKTLLARAIHNASERRNLPFVEVNCGALPESLLESELFGHMRGAFTGAIKDRAGKFEAADKGTIFLDEIGTSSLGFQVKLLRVIQDRIISRLGDSSSIEVDVRVILATNVDLEQAVKDGTFREDLYYRINVVPLEMPPLRERIGDIEPLAERFRIRYCEENRKQIDRFTSEALDCLVRAPWPGNIRQLENVIERAVVLCEGGIIDCEDLPTDLRRILHEPMPSDLLITPQAHLLPLKEALAAPEKLLIERALSHHTGNRQATATSLGINRSTLFNKMRKFDLL